VEGAAAFTVATSAVPPDERSEYDDAGELHHTITRRST
jgi:hypothetical protein